MDKEYPQKWFHGTRFLMEANFHAYRQLLDAGYEKEKAAACMETVQDFLGAGWKELYRKLHSA